MYESLEVKDGSGFRKTPTATHNEVFRGRTIRRKTGKSAFSRRTPKACQDIAWSAKTSRKKRARSELDIQTKVHIHSMCPEPSSPSTCRPPPERYTTQGSTNFTELLEVYGDSTSGTLTTEMTHLSKLVVGIADKWQHKEELIKIAWSLRGGVMEEWV